MVNVKLVIGGTMIAVMAAALTAYLVLNGGGNGSFYLEANGNDGSTLYLVNNAGSVNYDIVTPFQPKVMENSLILDRYTSSSDGSSYSLVSTLLVNGVIPTLNITTNGRPIPMWKEKMVFSTLTTPVISKSGSTISITIGNDTQTIVLDSNNKPISFAGMVVTKYSTDPSLFNQRPTASIPNPNADNIALYSTNEIVSNATVTGNQRMLNNALSSSYYLCAYKFAWSAYHLNPSQDYVSTGNCNGLNTVGFMGTTTLDMSTIVSDILGVGDNFRNGYRNLNWGTGYSYSGPDPHNSAYSTPVVSGGSPSTVYDLCVGHSLGGAEAKYAATLGKCKNVITFGCPYTTGFPSNVPITQYVHISSNGGCCSRYWWGGCADSSEYYQDPVTTIGTIGGSHTNPTYVGGSGNCASNIAVTILYTGASMHQLPYYPM